MKKKNITVPEGEEIVEPYHEVVIGRIKPKLREIFDGTGEDLQSANQNVRSLRSNIAEIQRQLRTYLEREAEASREVRRIIKRRKNIAKDVEKKVDSMLSMIKRRKDILSFRIENGHLVVEIKGFPKEIDGINYITPDVKVLFDFRRRNVLVKPSSSKLNDFLDRLGGRINPFLESGSGYRRMCLGETEGAFNTAFLKNDIYSLITNAIILLKSNNTGSAYSGWGEVGKYYLYYHFDKLCDEKGISSTLVRVKDTSYEGRIDYIFMEDGNLLARLSGGHNVEYSRLILQSNNQPLPEIKVEDNVIKL